MRICIPKNEQSNYTKKNIYEKGDFINHWINTQMCKKDAFKASFVTHISDTDNTHCLDIYYHHKVTKVLINPRRACAARVTVVVLSFRPSVCLLPRFLPLRARRRPTSDTNGFSATLALF